MKLLKKWSWIFKLLFVAGIFYFLAQKGFLSLETTKNAFTQWQIMLPVAFAFTLTTFLSFYRWQILLKAQNIHLKYWRVAQLTMVGNFFNIALPGAVSGDFVKALYLSKEQKGQGAKAFGSILFDRVAGLSALIIVCAGAMIIDFSELDGTPLFKAVQAFVTILALSFVAFYLYLFWVKEQHDPLLKLLKFAEVKVKKANGFTRIYEGLRQYHHHRKIVAGAISISLIIHLVVCTAFIFITHAVGEQFMSPYAIYVIVPLGLLITAIPITPAGVGTGHVAFSALFHFLSSERGADIFSIYMVFQLCVASAGGLVYLKFKSKNNIDPLLVSNSPTENGI